MRFAGKIALVTGARSGIGRAVARALASEGASVALNDLEPMEALVSELGDSVCSEHVADVSHSDGVEKTMDEVDARWGRLDILFANAGINRDGFVSDLSDADWEDVLRVNLSGPFYACRAAFSRLPPGGAIVLTSSVSALGNLGQSNYAASKAGLIGLVRSLALEGASYGIRANAVAPGFTRTPMVESIPERVRAKILKRVPLGRMAAPEEIARAMLFLASEDASYVTGQTLFVDGGVSVGL